MNYARIYDEFISDCKAKEPKAVIGLNYSARGKLRMGVTHNHHHIVPVSNGGTNAADNLVTLDIYDHIKAHWYYAKAFGGTNWACLRLLLDRRDVTKLTESQIDSLAEIQADVMKNHAKSMRGGNNGFYGKTHTQETIAKLSNDEVQTLRSFRGGHFIGTRVELCALTGMLPSDASRLFLGVSKSVNGWYSETHNPNGYTKKDLIRNTISDTQDEISLYHSDGATWTGKPIDAPVIMAAFNKSSNGHKNKHVKGWFQCPKERDNYDHYKKTNALKAAASRGDIRGKNNPNYGVDRRIDKQIKVVNAKTGETFSGSSKHFCDVVLRLSHTAHTRMLKTLEGRKIVKRKVVKSFHGWSIV